LLCDTLWPCAGSCDTGQVAGSAASVVVRPVQSAVINGANTNASVPVVCPPNFPSIHQALRGAASQPVSVATTSAITTATTSVVPNPAVIKTMLASKLARNMTHQQQTDVNSLPGTSTSTTSVPLSSSPTSVSAATSATDVDAVMENAAYVGAAAGESVNKHSGELSESNGMTVAVTSSTATVSASSCLANGHAKQLHASSALVNGICSPAPSCSSEDQESLRGVKVPKSPGYDNECDGVVMNGDVVDNEVDYDDDVSELNDCEGDVLVKAMMHADIIDFGGRPAVTDNSCDDDSRLSADFLSGFAELTEEQAGTADTGTSEQVTCTDTAMGFDSETAAAVADLLHETGMMADDEGTVSSANDNCLSFDFDATVTEGDNQCTISATSDALSIPTADHAPTSANVDSSVDAAVVDEQLDCQTSTADIAEQMLVEKPEPSPVAASFVGPTDAAVGAAARELACSAHAVNASLPPLSSSAVLTQPVVSSMPAAAQLQNGVMVVPPRGISLPSGQFISGGTRLLIRPMTSVSSTPSGSLSVRLTHPTHAAATQSTASAQSGSSTVASTSSSLVADVNSQLPGCSVTSSSAPAVRFVSSTTSQGQLIIQRAQVLTTPSSPMIQRVLLPQTPRAIAMRSEGQTILQGSQSTNQQVSSRPVLLTQAPFRAGPLGQLRVAAPSMQLVSASSAAPTQIVLQSGHVISVQQQQPSTHDAASDQMQLAASSNLPVLAAKPSLEQTATSQPSAGDVASTQPGSQTAAPGLSTSVKPPLRPLISTSQQPIQIVGGPLQLRAGFVGLPTGTGNAPVILQHGGRPILLQSPNVGPAQHPSSYVVFRPGPLPVQSSQDSSAISSSSSVGADTTSRKRPLLPSSATVTRSSRKKTRKDEDCGLPFICEWSGCQRYWLFLYFYVVVIAV